MNESEKVIGVITCSDIQENEDGSCKVIFDYDQKFKEEYKKMFNLKRFSKKHFEKTLDEAIKRYAEEAKKNPER